MSLGNEYYEVVDKVLFNKKEKSLVYYPCGLTDDTYIIPEGTLTIGQFAFEYSHFKNIKIPDSVTTIGKGAFFSCYFLESIEIPSSVTTIESLTFWGCDRLKNVKIPDSLTTIGNLAFDGCYGLSSITIPLSVTAIGDYAFNLCGIFEPEGVTLLVERDSYAAQFAENKGLSYDYIDADNE